MSDNRSPSPARALSRQPAALLAAGCFLFSLTAAQSQAEEHVFASLEEITTPAGPDAREPALFARPGGPVHLIWTEPSSEGFAVRTAALDGAGWTAPSTVVSSDDLFVNWADFPSVAVLNDGAIAAHWLRESGATGYDYDVNLAFSRDSGTTWSAPITPHGDGTESQHGFVSLVPVEENRLAVIWLDGRAYESGSSDGGARGVPDAMQLRAAFANSGGNLSPETVLDIRTCSCCQTSAAVAADNILLVAYRDRTPDEIRDISVVRLSQGKWSEPQSVHTDGWEISGCPVNGPAIAAHGTNVVVAWFTGARDIPAVNIAFSHDAGITFDPPFRVDAGGGVGRVGALMLEDGSALVSWVEWTEAREEIHVCRAEPGEGCGRARVIARNTAAGSVNFPQMARNYQGVFIAWTQPGEAGAPDSVRLVRGQLDAP